MDKFGNLNVPELEYSQDRYCRERITRNGCAIRCDSCLFGLGNIQQFTQWLQQREAAGELLAALKNLISRFNEDVSNYGYVGLEQIEQAKAAIAKAEGK